ncbi:MAG: hypothetical protein MEQ84_07990 [Mesorhizobium sp.]|nr:hypothetical protein [Mesorhizobium sp.]
MWFGHDLSFWVAVAAAVIFKVVTSQFQSLWRAFATVFAAVFFAYFFTDAAVDWLQLDPETYKAPVAALLALTGEGITRLVFGWLNNPDILTDVIKAWRGHK